MFKTIEHSHKTSACAHLTGQIEAAATAMGLIVERDTSRQSASHYLYIGADEDALTLKIRVSDHDDQHGGSDWRYCHDAALAPIVERLAEHYGRPVPAGFSAEDLASRSATARKAVDTRRQKADDWEARAVAALLGALQPISKIPGKPTLGNLFDQAFGDRPRAERQRVVQAVIDHLKADAEEAAALEAIAAVGSDPTLLVGLIQRAPYRSILQKKAKAALLALVGPETYSALRPAGESRFAWSSE